MTNAAPSSQLIDYLDNLDRPSTTDLVLGTKVVYYGNQIKFWGQIGKIAQVTGETFGIEWGDNAGLQFHWRFSQINNLRLIKDDVKSNFLDLDTMRYLPQFTKKDIISGTKVVYNGSNDNVRGAVGIITSVSSNDFSIKWSTSAKNFTIGKTWNYLNYHLLLKLANAPDPVKPQSMTDSDIEVGTKVIYDGPLKQAKGVTGIITDCSLTRATINWDKNTWNLLPTMYNGQIRTLLLKAPSIPQETSEMKINSQILADDILLILKDKGYVFGGYLRDQIAGVPFSDIDFFVESSSYHSVIQVLKENGFSMISIGPTKTSYSSDDIEDGFTKKEIIVAKEGISVKIDLVSSNNLSCNTPFQKLDADINGLWFSHEDGAIRAAQGLDLETVKKHIKDKVYVVPGDNVLSMDRKYKLQSKGYSLADAKYTSTSVNPKMKPSVKKETKKVERLSMIEMMKSNARKAFWQSLATQTVEAVQAAFLLSFKEEGFSDEEVSIARKMLASKAGGAGISVLLGIGLCYAPMIGDDPRAQILAEYLQVNGMSTGYNLMFEQAKKYIMPAIMQVFSGLPPVTEEDMKELEQIRSARTRIASPNDAVAQQAEHEAIAEEQDKTIRKSA